MSSASSRLSTYKYPPASQSTRYDGGYHLGDDPYDHYDDGDHGGGDDAKAAAAIEDEDVARTPSPTPSEERELQRTGAFDWKALSKWRFWIRREWLWYYIIAFFVTLVAILVTWYHKPIVHWLEPFATKLHSIPGGWSIPVAILFVISFPPLFGHEIVAVLCGLVWGLWAGFGIVALGTFLGEVGNFYAFKYVCLSRGRALERSKLSYALLAHAVRTGGLRVALVARLSAIPGHFTTAVFSTCGMGIGVFSVAAVLSLPKQFVTVYLGVILEQSDKGTPDKKSRIASNLVLAATAVITIAAMWYIYAQMGRAKPAVIYARRKARQAKLGRARSTLALMRGRGRGDGDGDGGVELKPTIGASTSELNLPLSKAGGSNGRSGQRGQERQRKQTQTKAQVPLYAPRAQRAGFASSLTLDPHDGHGHERDGSTYPAIGNDPFASTETVNVLAPSLAPTVASGAVAMTIDPFASTDTVDRAGVNGSPFGTAPGPGTAGLRTPRLGMPRLGTPRLVNDPFASTETVHQTGLATPPSMSATAAAARARGARGAVGTPPAYAYTVSAASPVPGTETGAGTGISSPMDEAQAQYAMWRGRSSPSTAVSASSATPRGVYHRAFPSEPRDGGARMRGTAMGLGSAGNTLEVYGGEEGDTASTVKTPRAPTARSFFSPGVSPRPGSGVGGAALTHRSHFSASPLLSSTDAGAAGSGGAARFGLSPSASSPLSSSLSSRVPVPSSVERRALRAQQQQQDDDEGQSELPYTRSGSHGGGA